MVGSICRIIVLSAVYVADATEEYPVIPREVEAWHEREQSLPAVPVPSDEDIANLTKLKQKYDDFHHDPKIVASIEGRKSIVDEFKKEKAWREAKNAEEPPTRQFRERDPTNQILWKKDGGLDKVRDDLLNPKSQLNVAARNLKAVYQDRGLFSKAFNNPKFWEEWEKTYKATTPEQVNDAAWEALKYSKASDVNGPVRLEATPPDPERAFPVSAVRDWSEIVIELYHRLKDFRSTARTTLEDILRAHRIMRFQVNGWDDDPNHPGKIRGDLWKRKLDEFAKLGSAYYDTHKGHTKEGKFSLVPPPNTPQYGKTAMGSEWLAYEKKLKYPGWRHNDSWKADPRAWTEGAQHELSREPGKEGYINMKDQVDTCGKFWRANEERAEEAAAHAEAEGLSHSIPAQMYRSCLTEGYVKKGSEHAVKELGGSSLAFADTKVDLDSAEATCCVREVSHTCEEHWQSWHLKAVEQGKKGIEKWQCETAGSLAKILNHDYAAVVQTAGDFDSVAPVSETSQDSPGTTDLKKQLQALRHHMVKSSHNAEEACCDGLQQI